MSDTIQNDTIPDDEPNWLWQSGFNACAVGKDAEIVRLKAQNQKLREALLRLVVHAESYRGHKMSSQFKLWFESVIEQSKSALSS